MEQKTQNSHFVLVHACNNNDNNQISIIVAVDHHQLEFKTMPTVAIKDKRKKKGKFITASLDLLTSSLIDLVQFKNCTKRGSDVFPDRFRQNLMQLSCLIHQTMEILSLTVDWKLMESFS